MFNNSGDVHSCSANDKSCYLVTAQDTLVHNPTQFVSTNSPLKFFPMFQKQQKKLILEFLILYFGILKFVFSILIFDFCILSFNFGFWKKH